MSKHVRKGEPYQQSRQHDPTTVMADRPEGSATPDLSGALPVAEGAEAAAPLGKYWIVIVLWVIGFATMIFFEIISALFKR
jgi:hypothetical protein